MSALLLALALALQPPAHGAEEVAPLNNDSSVLVSWPSGDDVFFPLQGGADLTYDTPGPIQLIVQLRRRLPANGSLPPPEEVLVLGDGHHFMTIRATLGAEPEAVIYDDLGGIPSAAEVARIEVPAGGKKLALRNPVGGSTYLVHVAIDRGDQTVASGTPAPALISPTVAAAAAGAGVPLGPGAEGAGSETGDGDDDRVAVADASQEGPAAEGGDPAAEGGDPAAEGGDPDPPDDGTLEGPTLDSSLDDSSLDDSSRDDSSRDDRAPDVPPRARVARRPLFGPEVGAGVPLPASDPVVYAGGHLILPLVGDVLDARVRAGWYRVVVDQEVQTIDPHLGAVNLHANWKTSVIPVSLGLAVHTSGDAFVRPLFGVAGTASLASLTEHEATTRALVFGYEAIGGVELRPSIGRVQAALVYGASRADLGRTAVGGEAVSERLDTVRLDLNYLYGG